MGLLEAWGGILLIGMLVIAVVLIVAWFATQPMRNKHKLEEREMEMRERGHSILLESVQHDMVNALEAGESAADVVRRAMNGEMGESAPALKRGNSGNQGWRPVK